MMIEHGVNASWADHKIADAIAKADLPPDERGQCAENQG